MPETDFNWKTASQDGSVAIPAVEAIAVYTNPDDNIVIRQQNSMGDDDSFIVIPKAGVSALVKALRAAAK